jgi:hypothetical protein
MTLLAFHGSPDLRAATLAQMQAHADADAFAQGFGYWEAGKGCAVGCLTHDPSGGHAEYPIRWGIPRVLAHLEDRIFEGLVPDLARAWPMRFLSSIPLGADLSGVWPRFALDMLTDPDHGVLRHTDPRQETQARAKRRAACRGAIERVANLLRRTVSGTVALETWREAADAAADAYAADADARRAHYAWMADRLVAHLAAAPIPTPAA